MTALLVALGGGLGAVARHLLAERVGARRSSPFPLATLLINVTGSLALGALLGVAARGELPGELLLGAGVGFLGGFTTFSTFAFETLRLVEEGAWRHAALYLALSGPLCFASAAAAYLLAR